MNVSTIGFVMLLLLSLRAGVFMWNLVSWDVLGVHPLSFAGDGLGYKSRKVSDMVAQHNRAAY